MESVTHQQAVDIFLASGDDVHLVLERKVKEDVTDKGEVVNSFGPLFCIVLIMANVICIIYFFYYSQIQYKDLSKLIYIVP